MPTDSSAGHGAGHPSDGADDDLTFAVQDLGRERMPEPPPKHVDFAPVNRAGSVQSPTVNDGFVIQPQSVAPAAPVDVLVVGAPEPVAAPDAPSPSPNGFVIGSTSSTTPADATAKELWTTRDPAPEPTAAVTHPSRRGWATRHSEVVDRSAHATMLRLREEAVNVSWKAAWVAVTAADPSRLRKRRTPSG